MRRVCERAAERGVAVGAQVGYRDLAGFGRRFVDVEPHALTQDVIYQLGALDAFARTAGTRVRYLKPHGALYNAIVHHEAQAAAVVAAVRRRRPRPAGARAARLALAGARRRGGADHGPRGVRRPRLRAGRHAGPARAARRGAARPRRDRRAVRRDGHRRHGHRRRRRGARAGPAVDLRARRHPGRGRDRPRGAGRARPGAGVDARGPFACSAERASECERWRGRAGAAPSWSSSTDLDEVLALYAALVDEPLPGVRRRRPGREHRPAGRRPRGSPRREEAGEAVRRVRPRPGARPRGEQVELPVRYDGEDLDDVAGLLGCSPQEVVARHTGTAWTVAFCGFAPGFGYLTADDGGWDVPRRETPRTRVPAGSVALAGPFSGVYPRASPGGWQLLGTTSVRVLDPAATRRPCCAPAPGCGSSRSRRDAPRWRWCAPGAAVHGAGRGPARPGRARHRPLGRLRPRLVPPREPAGRQRARRRRARGDAGRPGAAGARPPSRSSRPAPGARTTPPTTRPWRCAPARSCGSAPPRAACAPTSRSAAGSTSSRSWARGPPTCWAVSGPPSLAAGDLLPVGATTQPMPGVDHAPVPEPPAGEVSGAGAARTAPRLVRRRRLGARSPARRGR